MFKIRNALLDLESLKEITSRIEMRLERIEESIDSVQIACLRSEIEFIYETASALKVVIEKCHDLISCKNKEKIKKQSVKKKG